MSERTAVQNPMLRYADAIGWDYVSAAEALRLRGGEAGLFFTDVLREQLLKLNPGIVDEARADWIIRQLTLLRADITGNRDALLWLRGEKSVFVPEENRERNVRLVDFDDLTQNLYHVTDEWTQRNPRCANRADVVFLVNGIPVAVCETKNAGKPDGIAIGITQVRRYHRETPEMLLAPQVFEVTELLDFYYAATWSTSRKDLFNWKEERGPFDQARALRGPPLRMHAECAVGCPAQGDSAPWSYEEAVKSFFDRRRFLKVLHDYIIFLTKDDELTKVILRQHQTRAVEKVIERVAHPTKRRGLIWHTQGSGKTLTMITIAAKLLRDVRARRSPRWSCWWTATSWRRNSSATSRPTASAPCRWPRARRTCAASCAPTTAGWSSR